MRRIVALVIAVFVSLLACTTAAQAAGRTGAPLPPYRQFAGGSSLAPVSPGASATYRITGVVQNFDGSPLDRPEMGWGWYDPDAPSFLPSASVYHDGGFKEGKTDGSFSFARVTAHPGHDTMSAGTPLGTDGLMGIAEWGLDFSTASAYVIQPAHVRVSVANAPAGRTGYFELGDASLSLAASWSHVRQGSGVVDAVPPGFDAAVMNFSSGWQSVTAASEWTSPGHQTVPVSPGEVADATIAFDWSQAVHGRLAGRACQHSGSPGSVVGYRVWGLPAGEQVSFFGASDQTPAVHDFAQTVTSGGPDQSYTVWLQIPKDAGVGNYTVEAARSDDPRSLLQLYDNFDVGTIGASRSSVGAGGAVKLRGRLSAEKPNATLFMRQSPAGQPASLRAPGWTRAGTVRVGPHGSFVTPVLRPRRTSWYVLRYSGWRFIDRFTSVVQVKVRGAGD